MAIIRVNKTKNYTTISNYHLREKKMSYGAKGLLTYMLSLPNDWKFSMKGLINSGKEGEDAIRSLMNELKQFGYIKVTRSVGNKGNFEYIYDVFEESCLSNNNTIKQDSCLPSPVSPSTVGPSTVDRGSINSLSNDESLSNDDNIIITNDKESRNTDFATQRSVHLVKNSTKITDSSTEIDKIKNSTVCQLVEKEKNEINPPDPLYSSDEENLEQKDDFDDLFGEPVGTDKKSRLAQTNNSNGTLAKELFDYWNSKNLRVHRAFQSHYVERFSKLMQKYTMEQIKHIIDNYEKIVHDKVYYWSYVWDLQDFIEEEKFLRFADDGQEWLNYKQGTKSQQAFRRTAFHNEEYNQALKEGKDIGALDDMHAEEVRKLRSSPNVIKL